MHASQRSSYVCLVTGAGARSLPGKRLESWPQSCKLAFSRLGVGSPAGDLLASDIEKAAQKQRRQDAVSEHARTHTHTHSSPCRPFWQRLLAVARPRLQPN